MKVNIGTNSGHLETKALATAEIMGYTWFVHKDDFDDYRVSEWETGMYAYHCDAGFENAIPLARAYLESKGQQRVDEVIKQAREMFGTVNPPYQP